MAEIYTWVPGVKFRAKTWRTRPKIENFGQEAFRVRRRFETVWVIKNPSGALVGGTGDVFTVAHLRLEGRTLAAIGPQDPYAVPIVDNDLNSAWRLAMFGRRRGE